MANPKDRNEENKSEAKAAGRADAVDAGQAAETFPEDTTPSKNMAGKNQTSSAPAEADSQAVMDETEPETERASEDIIRQERDEFEERWLRSAAELDNFRKRTRRELTDARRFAVADLMRDLLEVLDNFERAMQSLQTSSNGEDVENIQAGIQLVYQRMKDILAEQGLRKIEALDQEFDPSLHEAIQQMEKEDYATGQIVEVVQTGYKLHDMVLRPSRVIVAK